MEVMTSGKILVGSICTNVLLNKKPKDFYDNVKMVKPG